MRTKLINRRVGTVRNRGFNAINRVRRGESKTLSQAARASGTTVKSIGRLLPAALIQDRPGGRIRVKAGDPYSATVEILTDQGKVYVRARGSRQRELAGQHRATILRVLRGKEPASALEQYRGKRVGGRELISDYNSLRVLAHAGEIGQLENLYASPDIRALITPTPFRERGAWRCAGSSWGIPRNAFIAVKRTFSVLRKTIPSPANWTRISRDQSAATAIGS